MSVFASVELTGGQSVYCINALQVLKAEQLFTGDGEEADRIRSAIASLETSMTRNERAAVAKILLERLRSGFRR
jgi:hypothetical protein